MFLSPQQERTGNPDSFSIGHSFSKKSKSLTRFYLVIGSLRTTQRDLSQVPKVTLIISVVCLLFRIGEITLVSGRYKRFLFFGAEVSDLALIPSISGNLGVEKKRATIPAMKNECQSLLVQPFFLTF